LNFLISEDLGKTTSNRGNTLQKDATLRNAPQIRLHEPPLPENQSLGYFLSHSCFIAPVQEEFQSLLKIQLIINQVAPSKPRDMVNHRQDEGLIIVETAIYRVFILHDLEFSSKNPNPTVLGSQFTQAVNAHLATWYIDRNNQIESSLSIHLI
jgi:hypothetical protein